MAADDTHSANIDSVSFESAALDAIGFIGAGAVGSTLARALAAHGAQVTRIAARQPEHAAALVAVLEAGAQVASPDALVAECDLVFLATPDDALAALALTLPWRTGQGVVHLSGARGADALAAVTARGAHAAALHPLMTFSSSALLEPIGSVLARLAGCTWALDATDDALRATLARMVSVLHGNIVYLPPEARAPYHLAGVFASNYVVALLGAAVALWREFGVEGDAALGALLPLLRGTVESLERNGLPQALTGPVARGDVGTLETHLAWLDAHATMNADMSSIDDAYRALAELAIPLALSKGSLSPTTADAIRRMLARHHHLDR